MSNDPGTQGYNPYAYAAGNPATLTDPTGHAVGVSALGDLAGAIGQLADAVVGLIGVLQLTESLPPVAQAFVKMLVLFGLMILRMLIVLTLMAVGTLVVGSIGGHLGTALFLLAFATAFQPMVDFATDYTSDPYTCNDLPRTFPVLPVVDDLCAIGVGAWLQSRARDIIGLIGLCGSRSATVGVPIAFEGSVTYCELLDRSRRYGFSISVGFLGGYSATPVGASTSFGVLLGLYFNSTTDLSGWSVQEDVSYSADRGIDANVSGSPAGTAVMLSLATGMEQSVMFGPGLTLIAVKTPGPLATGYVLRKMADIVWGSDPAN